MNVRDIWGKDESFGVCVVSDGLLEDNQHLLLVDLVVLVQVCVLDELSHLHQVRLSIFPQETQCVLEEVENFEVLQPAVGIDIVLEEDLIHCLAQPLLWYVHSQLLQLKAEYKWKQLDPLWTTIGQEWKEDHIGEG